MLLLVLAITTAYLTGSIPFGYLAGRLIKDIDIREHGSGNIGATNVFRIIGKEWGVLVLFLDAAKGFLVVWVIAGFFYNRAPVITLDFYRIIMAAAVVGGHNWTIFLRFKGGKGVAASLGALSGICPLACMLSLLVWFVVMVIWKYVSLASLSAFTSLPVFVAVFYQQREGFLILVCFSVIIALFVGVRHGPNIKRLLQGKEKRITEK
ncbi:MAG: glycerol-3-phosphate 1-O-acyltransferase PlsY [Candidatus Omnitrophota bacterium]|nr:glycerol-3-phosphate 1-O-acyltransferase PlsY [Candidatus Omnitrophota bacterium]